jgi:hypothetical protein
VKSAASSTAPLPHDTTVCSRRPRRAPSALTATLPLADTSATGPGSAGATASPHSAQRSCIDTIPLPFGPHSGSDHRRAASANSRSSAAPPGASPKPAANTTAPPHPSAPACSTTAGAAAAGIATTTASTGSGSASTDAKHGTSPTDVYFGFTAKTRPG